SMETSDRDDDLVVRGSGGRIRLRRAHLTHPIGGFERSLSAIPSDQKEFRFVCYAQTQVINELRPLFGLAESEMRKAPDRYRPGALSAVRVRPFRRARSVHRDEWRVTERWRWPPRPDRYPRPGRLPRCWLRCRSPTPCWRRSWRRRRGCRPG